LKKEKKRKNAKGTAKWKRESGADKTRLARKKYNPKVWRFFYQPPFRA